MVRMRFSAWIRVAAGEGPISSASLLAGEVEEKYDGILFPLEMLDHGLTSRTNAPPPPRQARFAKQVRLDRHRVETGHVLCPVGAFHIELIRLRGHIGRIAFSAVTVQRQF